MAVALLQKSHSIESEEQEGHCGVALAGASDKDLGRKQDAVEQIYQEDSELL